MDIIESRLRAVDSLFIAGEVSNEISLLSFTKNVLSVLNPDNPTTETHPNDLFYQHHDSQQKAFVVACLLRFLIRSHNLHEADTNFRINMIKLFDETLLGSLYHSSGIDVKDQAFQKLSKLVGCVKSFELRLTEMHETFTSIENTHLFQPLLKFLNSEQAKVILHPFLPAYYRCAGLHEIREALQQYCSSASAKPLQRYQTARKVINDYSVRARDYGTIYSSDLARVAEKLAALLGAHFERNPAAQPAHLILSHPDKRYPLHIEAREISVIHIVRNEGTGYASAVEIEVCQSTLSLIQRRYFLGMIEPGASVEIHVRAQTDSSDANAAMELKAVWTDFDGTLRSKSQEFWYECQRTDVPWDDLSKLQPYTLDAVSRSGEFVGRAEILDELEALVTANDSVGSAMISGQKRVGKTSIVKVLADRLKANTVKGVTVLYLESGDYISRDPQRTIENVGQLICHELKRSDSHFSTVDDPTFSGDLSPLTTFLRTVQELKPERRYLFILDEFDELPLDTYKRGELADAFFQTLRSISGKPSYGFVLVGSEKMAYVISCQGDTLNKFTQFRVTYFDREKHWHDFSELVRRPVQEWVHVTDEALNTLYGLTAGNPYFTKLICRTLFRIVVQRRDSYVTPVEVREATAGSLRDLGSHEFQHFWEDGICDIGPKVEERSMRRRKVLVALASVLRQRQSATFQSLSEEAQRRGIGSVSLQTELDDLVRRKVLGFAGTEYSFAVKLFGDWLMGDGFNDIVTTLVDEDVIGELAREDERFRVKAGEIGKLVGRWGVYKGQRIGEEKVRAWLNQFGDNRRQRLMFRTLEAIDFWDGARIRQVLRDLHKKVRATWIVRPTEGKKARQPVLVGYVDGVGKSGAHLARLYAEENDLASDWVVEQGDLENRLKELARKRAAFALVFVDDFIGTGDSVGNYLGRLPTPCWDTIKDLCAQEGEIGGTQKLTVYFLAMTGFVKAKENLNKTIAGLHLPVEVVLWEPLSENRRVFGETSESFPTESERNAAKEIAYEHGRQLLKKTPYGYGDCQSAIVFEHSCPNNNLPILWCDGTSFEPLFRR